MIRFKVFNDKGEEKYFNEKSLALAVYQHDEWLDTGNRVHIHTQVVDADGTVLEDICSMYSINVKAQV